MDKILDFADRHPTWAAAAIVAAGIAIIAFKFAVFGIVDHSVSF